MPALFVIFSVLLLLQAMSLHLTFGIVLQERQKTLAWPEWEMSPIRLPWKEHLWWRSVVCLSFSPLRAAGENIYHHSSPCTDKVSLFIQSGRDKLWMRHCGTERKGKGEERDKEAACLPRLCVSMWADGMYWKPISAQAGHRSTDPLSLTPFQPQPAVAFPASTCSACTNPSPLWERLYNVIQ